MKVRPLFHTCNSGCVDLNPWARITTFLKVEFVSICFLLQPQSSGCHCCITSESSCSSQASPTAAQSPVPHDTGTDSLYMSPTDVSNRSHPTWESQRGRKPIWHNPAGCVRRMSFNSSRWISIFQFVTHAAGPGAGRCRAGTVCSGRGGGGSGIKDCYSKMDFL